MTRTSSAAPTERYLIGIDVGTGSARAGVFSADGRMVGSGKCPITLYREAGSIVEQSSDEIWTAVATAVRAAMAEATIPPEAVAGLGFDGVDSVRAGKIFELEVAEGTSDAAIDDMCRKLLANTVIENYRVERAA